MSIQGEIDRINNNVSDALAATAEMGASVPETANSNDLGRLIRSIPQSGGGGTSINVTAEVGQTIVVEEVDASGKPTKWKAADYQPRTHWKESIEILPETTYTLETFDGTLPTIQFIVGEKYILRFNGVEYISECIDFKGVQVIGNTDIATGGDNGCPVVIITRPMEENGETVTTIEVFPPEVLEGIDAITLSIVAEVHHTIPEQYLPKQQYIYEISYDQLEYVKRAHSDGGSYYLAYASEIPSALLKAMLQNIPIYLKVLDDVGEMNKPYYTATTWCGLVSTVTLDIVCGAGWEERDVLPVGDTMEALDIRLSAMISHSVNNMEPVYIRFVSETGV